MFNIVFKYENNLAQIVVLNECNFSVKRTIKFSINRLDFNCQYNDVQKNRYI